MFFGLTLCVFAVYQRYVGIEKKLSSVKVFFK